VRLSVPRSTIRILAVWAGLLSLENAIAAARRPTDAYALTDWLEGQFLGMPFALALLVPCAVLSALAGRAVVARRLALLAGSAAVLAVAVAYALTTGPSVAGPALRIPLVAGAAVCACLGTIAVVWKVPLARPRLLATLGATATVVAWIADQRVLPGLYPVLHGCLVAAALAGGAVVSLALPERWPTISSAKLRLGGALATAWALVGALLLSNNENVRFVLLRDAPILGRFVLLSAHLPFPRAAHSSDGASADIHRVIRARDMPRTLDWSGCDVLLITVDALRPDRLGAYGNPRPTSPNFDQLAKRGARFEYAYTAAPNTSYATMSLLVGRNIRPLLVNGGTVPRTWADHLRDLGYETLALYPPEVFNVDGHRFQNIRQRGLGFARSFEQAADAPELAERVSSFVATAPNDRPTFIWAHVFEPHSPYVMHPEFPFSGEGVFDAYDSEVAAADAFIGKAVAALESRGRCSVLIVTADHGEAFDEHGTSYHGNSVYEEQVRVPLLIVAPGVVPAVISRPVQTIDLLPTMLSALGRRRPDDVTGRDLGRVMTGSGDRDDPGLAFAETGRYSVVATGTDRLICDRAAKTCIHYDLKVDPLQRTAIRGDSTRRGYLQRLTSALAQGDEPDAELPLRLSATNLRLRRGNVTVDGEAAIATGVPGPVLYGPYVKLGAGSYAVRWRGRGLAAPGKLSFSVRADSGGEILARTMIEASALAETEGDLARLSFALDRLRYEVELVIESGDGARVSITEVVLEKVADDPRHATEQLPLALAATDARLHKEHSSVEHDMVVANGEPGPLVFGPYVQLPTGSYQLVWTGQGVSPHGSLVFSVQADGGREVLARTVMNAADLARAASAELVRLPFTLDRYRSQIEFVVESADGGRVALAQLVVEELGARSTTFPLQIAATHPDLKRGKVDVDNEHLVATGEPGALVFGPYLQLPAGEYELHWRGRALGTDGKVGFSVTADAGKELIAQAIVENKDLPTESAPLVRIPFRLDRQRSQLEFLVESAEGGRISLDEVVIERRAAP
jgi:hypothetical protein